MKSIKNLKFISKSTPNEMNYYSVSFVYEKRIDNWFSSYYTRNIRIGIKEYLN